MAPGGASDHSHSHAPATQSVLRARARREPRSNSWHRLGIPRHRRLLATRLGLVKKFFVISLPAALVALLTLVVGVEVWTRLTWNPLNGTPGFFLSDPVRVQRLAPGYSGWFAGVPVKINRLALRDDREYDLVKAPTTFRILVLGDSVTFGHGSL